MAVNVSIVQSYVANLDAVRCIITGLNSVIFATNDSYSPSFHGSFTNCCIQWSKGSQGPTSFYNCTYINCILSSTLPSRTLTSTSQAYNCIGILPKNATISSLFPTLHPTCLDLKDAAEFFKDVAVFKEDTFYELLDQYKSFATSDGKEVGIYGGNLGFDITPSNPQITRFNVAPKTSVDGKLSIEIEVQGIE